MNESKKIVAYIAFLATSVFAAPQPATKSANARVNEPPISQTLMQDSADGSRPTEVARVSQRSEHLQGRMAEPPEHLTIEIINSYGECHPERCFMSLFRMSHHGVSRRLTVVIGQEITTAHASNPGSPTPVGGPILPGVVPNGTTTSFAVPTGWAGNVAMNRANMSVTGDVTLLEASFVV